MRTVMKSAIITDSLRNMGLPGLRGVWAHEAGGGRSLLYRVDRASALPWTRPARPPTWPLRHERRLHERLTVVVDSDVDPRDLGEVMWAICGRCDPGSDIEVMRRTWGSRVDPLTLPASWRSTARAVIDACRPFER